MPSKTRIHQTTRAESAVPGGRRITLGFRTSGEEIPAILMLPGATRPVPGALLLHGYSSRKEDLSESMGPALLRRGIASLAIDLPLHGTRSRPLQKQAAHNPLELFGLWRQAREEAALAAAFLRARAEVDVLCTAVLGYSLGSYLAVQLTAEDPAVRAVVLAAGGDLPAGTPLAAVARGVADPIRAAGRISPRPLLMVHGRNDRTVRPEQAERLFAAAGEPKEIRWWDAGHILPPPAIGYVAGWLADRLRPAEA